MIVRSIWAQNALKNQLPPGFGKKNLSSNPHRSDKRKPNLTKQRSILTILIALDSIERSDFTLNARKIVSRQDLSKKE